MEIHASTQQVSYLRLNHHTIEIKSVYTSQARISINVSAPIYRYETHLPGCTAAVGNNFKKQNDVYEGQA